MNHAEQIQADLITRDAPLGILKELLYRNLILAFCHVRQAHSPFSTTYVQKQRRCHTSEDVWVLAQHWIRPKGTIASSQTTTHVQTRQVGVSKC